LWSRLKETLGRWFRREPAPGRYVEGRAAAWNGWLAIHPTVLPRRDYLLYVPKGASRFRRMPLIVLLHGCNQSAEEIARGARIAPLADRLGSYVLLPKQSEKANPYRCWNWFDHATAEGRGEAAIVASMMRKAMRWRRRDDERTAVVGMSAGGALAAILGIHHGDAVRAVVTVAGIASGAVTSPLTALTVMKRGPETDVAAIGHAAHEAAGDDARRIPLLAIHGRHDNVVAARHRRPPRRAAGRDRRPGPRVERRRCEARVQRRRGSRRDAADREFPRDRVAPAMTRAARARPRDADRARRTPARANG
jgi:poly(hydroxyalkanoate) depolymerase family esterase